MILINSKLLSNYLLTEMLVDKSSTAKFCVESMSKNLIEALLVMIISMPAGIIDTTDIKHGIQCIKDLRVASADDVGAGELGGEADEEAAERLVAVEAAVVGPHSLAAPSAVLAAGWSGRVDPQPLRRGGGRRRERRHGGERAPDLGSPGAEERRPDGSLRHPPGGGEHATRFSRAARAFGCQL